MSETRKYIRDVQERNYQRSVGYGFQSLRFSSLAPTPAWETWAQNLPAAPSVLGEAQKPDGTFHFMLGIDEVGTPPP